MPDTEEIVKVRFEDFRQLIHGKQNTIKLYSLDDVYLKESSADEWVAEERRICRRRRTIY